MIGKIVLAVIDSYDLERRATYKKTLPVVVVGGPYESDYIVLPISTITKRENTNPYYDLLVSPQDRVILSLSKECFVRTHKQTTVHVAALLKELGDMKTDTPDLYLNVLTKMKKFQKGIVKTAF